MLARTLICLTIFAAVSGSATGAILGGTVPGINWQDVTDPEVFLAVWDGSGATQNTRLVDLGIGLSSTDWNSNFSFSGLAFNDLGSELRYAVLVPAVLDGSHRFQAARIGFSAAPSFDVNEVFLTPAGAFNEILR